MLSRFTQLHRSCRSPLSLSHVVSQLVQSLASVLAPSPLPQHLRPSRGDSGKHQLTEGMREGRAKTWILFPPPCHPGPNSAAVFPTVATGTFVAGSLKNLADFWTVFGGFYSRFDRWAALGRPGPPVPAISGRVWGVRGVRARIEQIYF
jgi:hypothetical protein